MPSKILTDLAPELIIQILKSSDSFADITVLSSTSRKVFIIWKRSVDTICNAVLKRTVPCFAQACELVDAEKKGGGHEHSILGYQSAVGRVQRMLQGADSAASAVAYLDKCNSNFWAKKGRLAEKPIMTPAEKTDLLQA